MSKQGAGVRRNQRAGGVDLDRRSILAAGAAALLCNAQSAQAQVYPSRPVHLVVPFEIGRAHV